MGSSERRRGGEVLAVLLVGVGTILLLLRLFNWHMSDDFWPSFIIVPGIALLASAMLAAKSSARVLAVAGAIVTATGLILLLQMLTDYYQSWAYAWALLPLSSGIALMAVGMRDDDAPLTASGRGVAMFGAVMFAVFGVVFEGLVFGRILPIGEGFVLPVILIGAGLLVLFRRMLPAWPEHGHRVSEGSKPQSDA